MAVRKGAAAAVLTRQSHAVTVFGNRPEGKRFGGRPVEPGAARKHLALGIEDTAERLVYREVGGDRGQQGPEPVELCIVERGADVAAPKDGLVGAAKPRPAPFEPVGLVGQIGGAGLELALEQGNELPGALVDPRLIDHALGDQAFGVDLADRRVLRDRGVHQRLGEAGFVAFIVPEAAVAPHVDDDVAVEALAIFDCQLAAKGDRFGIVAVDVKDRCLDRFGDVRGVRR